MDTTASEAILRQQTTSVMALAQDRATTDAADFLHPATPTPNHSESMISAQRDRGREALKSAQRDETQSAGEWASRMRRYLDAFNAGKAHLPRVAGARVVPYEWVPLVGIGVIEATALHSAIETLLSVPTGSYEGWLIAGSTAVMAAILAHTWAMFTGAERRSSGHIQARNRRWALCFLALLVLVGIGATMARIYSSNFTTSTETLDPTGIAFFVGLQVVFVGVNLACAHNLRNRAEDRWQDAAQDELGQAQAAVADLPEEHARQLASYDASCRQGLFVYLAELARLMPDLPFQVGWIDRTARETADGSLLHTVFPTMPAEPAADFDDGRVAGAGDGREPEARPGEDPDDRAADEADPIDVDVDGEGDDGAADNGGGDEPGGYTDEDLFAAILNDL